MKTLAISGIITGLVISGWMYLEFLAGFHGSAVGRYTGFAALIFTILGIFFGIRAYRIKERAGQMNFWQGVLAGVVISVFAGLITAIFTFVYFSYINPGFVDYMVNLNRQTLEQHGATDVQVQSNEIVTRELFQPLPQALRAFGGYVAAGSLFSLIIAGLLKTKRQDAA
ncbi:MAG: DUF4199 domain-containing protein [Adhaeribacter sp.]